MKKIIISALLIILMLIPQNVTALEGEVEVEPKFTVEKIEEFTDNNLYNYTLAELKELIATQREIQVQAHALAETARSLGWPEDSETILMAKAEHWNAKLAIKVYQARYDELKWGDKMTEYPVATEIWRYMKNLGWNDYVCAGILGNIMTEVGGQTLNIEPLTKGKGYYGICQWNKGYKDAVWDKDLVGQLDYLRDSIKYNFDTFGYAYKKGFNYEAFLKLENETEAAEAFRACYERSTTASRAIRKQNATVAYNYFVN